MSDEIEAKPAGEQDKIVPRLISEEMKTSYLEYSMSVIVGRALPDVRDGLKPVHRRVLYTMLELGLQHNKSFKKCARIVGDCLGKYHPHGDTAVYDALVRMAQGFSLRYPLVHGQGNFGSVDGDRAAAMRYCVTGDSLVVTEKGLVRMDELSDSENIDLKILSKDKKVNKASKWFDSGSHPTLSITTNKGYSLTGTYNHPLLTLTKDKSGKPLFEWKLLEKIQEGDVLVIDRASDEFWPKEKIDLTKYYPEIIKRTKIRKLPKYLDEDLAFIIGSFLSEGTLSANKIEFCNTDEEWIELMSEVWKNVFPDSKLHRFIRKPSSFGKKEYYRLECHCKYTLRFLKNIGLRDVKSADRKIPKLILKSPKSVIKMFIKTYFEGDGSISYAKKMIELSCCSKSKHLMKELQVLFLRFGIDTFRRFDERKEIWKLYLRGYRNILRFYKEIGFVSERKNKKLEFVVYNYKKESSILDYVPFISDYIRSKTCSKFIRKNNFDRYPKMRSNYGRISSILIQETEVDYTSLFEYFLTYDYLFDEVVQIQESGSNQVFSIKVESNCHSFISNGFISHNTEAKLKQIAEEMLEDIDKDTVDFAPNFDGSMKEPTVLPAKIPNLLVNGSAGIAVGMATNIPPHNLKEVCSGAIAYINNPKITDDQLMQNIPAPDFPTGGILFGGKGLRDAYTTGKGKIVLRGKTHVEEVKNRHRIIITEIPYMVNKAELIQQIAGLANDKKIQGISDIRDESDRDGMRIVIELKGTANPEVILNQLYRHSRLQESFGIINLALVNNQPTLLSIRGLIEKYVRHRQEIVRRKTAYTLKQAEEKAHLLEGLIICLDNLDDVVLLIRKAKNPAEAQQGLIKDYELTVKQAKAVLEMRLSRLTGLEQKTIREDHEKTTKLIVELRSILASEEKILEIIKTELQEVSDKYGDERRTNIVRREVQVLEKEHLVTAEDVVVTMTHTGYIKRLKVDTYKAQRRGGRGITGTKTKQEDFVENLFIANTHDYLLMFTTLGKVHWVKVYEIPEAGRYAKGTPAANLIHLAPGEKVKATIPVKEFDEQHYIFLATRNGIVKKTPLNDFSNPRKGGIIAVGLKEGDQLIGVEITDGKQDIILATKKGQAIRFSEETVRSMGRTAAGVFGIKMVEDEVVSMTLAKLDETLLTVASNGYGKRTPLIEYRQTGRAGVGVTNLKVTDKTGKVISVHSVKEDEEAIIVTQNGIVIRLKIGNISTIGRSTQGVRLMRPEEGDQVVSVAIIKPESE